MTLRAIWCYAFGHRDEFKRGQLVMRCMNCGRPSPGWQHETDTVKPTQPRWAREGYDQPDGREQLRPRRLRVVGRRNAS